MVHPRVMGSVVEVVAGNPEEVLAVVVAAAVLGVAVMEGMENLASCVVQSVVIHAHMLKHLCVSISGS